MIIESSRCNSACCGTRDCTKRTQRSGSNPAASQSRVDIHRILPQVGGVGVIGGEGMPVGDEKVAVVVVLQAYPVVEGAHVVAEMQFAGGPHAAQHALELLNDSGLDSLPRLYGKPSDREQQNAEEAEHGIHHRHGQSTAKEQHEEEAQDSQTGRKPAANVGAACGGRGGFRPAAAGEVD